jgi:hypothetical protein
MGTRRSKHNKGRKPLYKEHRLHLLADEPLFVAAARSQLPAPRPRRRATPKTVTPELLAEVSAFLEKRAEQRKEEEKYSAVVADLNAATVSRPERVLLKSWSGETAPHSERLSVSANDILMQMFVDHQIGVSLLRTGREWQRYARDAQIQPSQTVDWSGRGGQYQARGGPTERQWVALRWRASIGNRGGRNLVRSLDICLSEDVGRKRLVEICGLPAAKAIDALRAVLVRLEDVIYEMQQQPVAASNSFWQSDEAPRRLHMPAMRVQKDIPSDKSRCFRVFKRGMRSMVQSDNRDDILVQEKATRLVLADY